MKFDYVSWEAFATFLTGLLAVGAAVLIGLRQAAIVKKQAELDRHRLRYDLFDRRYKVYDLTKSVIAQMLFPRMHIETEVYLDFRKSIRGAKFLFDDETGRFLDLIWVSVDQTTEHLDGGRIRRREDLLVPGNHHFDRLNDSFKDIDARFSPWLSLTAIR